MIITFTKNFAELVKESKGKILIGIGEGKFQETVYDVIHYAYSLGWEKAKEESKKRQKIYEKNKV